MLIDFEKSELDQLKEYAEYYKANVLSYYDKNYHHNFLIEKLDYFIEGFKYVN